MEKNNFPSIYSEKKEKKMLWCWIKQSTIIEIYEKKKEKSYPSNRR